MARWHSCNILQIAPDANFLWHFDAKGGGFALNREHRGALDQPLPSRSIAKSWSSLWQPRLNVAWLAPENVFLRIIELPKSNFEETLAMVELQLEKLSPMPVTQIVWTIHILSHRTAPSRRSEAGAAAQAAGETKPEDLQTVVVVIVERSVVEEFLGKLEGRGFLADRLEVPMLDQLEATPATEDGRSRQNETAADVLALSGGAGRPERRTRGVVVRQHAAKSEFYRITARRRSCEEFEGPARAPSLGRRTGRLAGRAADPMASGGRPCRCRGMGNGLARRSGRARANGTAAAAGGTGGAHSATRGGGFAHSIAAR